MCWPGQTSKAFSYLVSLDKARIFLDDPLAARRWNYFLVHCLLVAPSIRTMQVQADLKARTFWEIVDRASVSKHLKPALSQRLILREPEITRLPESESRRTIQE